MFCDTTENIGDFPPKIFLRALIKKGFGRYPLKTKVNIGLYGQRTCPSHFRNL